MESQMSIHNPSDGCSCWALPIGCGLLGELGELSHLRQFYQLLTSPEAGVLETGSSYGLTWKGCGVN